MPPAMKKQRAGAEPPAVPAEPPAEERLLTDSLKESLENVRGGAQRTIAALAFRKAVASDRRKVGLVTWPELTEDANKKWRSPATATREEFAIELVETAVEVLTKSCRKVPYAGKLHCLVAKEPHREKGFHYHGVLIATVPTALWHFLEKALNSRGIGCDVRISADNKGVASERSILAYISTPTAEKHVLDRTPYASLGFPFPSCIQQERSKKFQTLARRPLDLGEMWTEIQNVFHLAWSQ